MANDIISLDKLELTFRKEVEEIFKGNVTCLQCATCSGGCPVAYEMDYTPREVIRMVQLGMRDKALSCKSIWVCASCNTCYTRCPGGIDIPEIMSSLRILSINEGIADKVHKEGSSFYKNFVKTITEYGRLFEPELALRYDLSMGLGHVKKHIPMGFKMLKHGKIHPIPKRVKQPKKLVRTMARIKKEVEG